MLRDKTKFKYVACIQDCYDTKIFNQRIMREKYNVDSNLFVALHQCNCIKSKNSIAKWTDVVLNEQVLENVLTVMVHIRKHKNLKRKEKRDFYKTATQLKLQPIKRIERVATMPVRVQEEPIQDTSNSKVIIILAVGAIVGFLIATIIWK